MSMKMKMAILTAKQRLKSNWEGMLKKLLYHHPTVDSSDGTTHRHTHSDGTHRPARRFEGGLKFKPWMPKQVPSGGNQVEWRAEPNNHSEDENENIVACRVSEIAEYLKVAIYDDDSKKIEEHPVQFLGWLDELQGYAVEYMEVAHELDSIDCLVPLLHHVLVYQQHAAGIRAKTAQLVTAMVHNNPTSQQLVMKLYGLDPLLFNFTQDLDATSRAKALAAISALIRNNKPGITAFLLADGPDKLCDALSSTDSVIQREALNLIHYLLHENSLDCDTVDELGILGLPRIMMHLAASSDDAEVRVAALRGLLVLVRYEDKKIRDKEGGNSGQLVVKNDDKLKQVLQQLIKRISAMAPEGLFAAREEMSLVDSLWNACSNEPSSLKRFEPFFRTWTAEIERCR